MPKAFDVPCAARGTIFRSDMRITNDGRGPWLDLRRAGIGLWAASLTLIAALAGGCAHSQKAGGGAFESYSVPRPPVFLNGAMALLLTNVSGFRAHAVLETGAAGVEGNQVKEGEVMCQGGKLLFAPGSDTSTSKRSNLRGSAFIWDVAANTGFVLNDPMQAYAPVTASSQFTNIVIGSPRSGAPAERISGHPCQAMEATVAASDGSLTGFRLWRATDLKGLSVRITRASSGLPLTLTLSKIQLEPVPEDLFQPPNSFAKYDSAERLMNEFAARQQNLKRRPSYQTENPEPGVGAPITAPIRQQ